MTIGTAEPTFTDAGAPVTGRRRWSVNRQCVDCGVDLVNRTALRCKPCRGRLQSANAGIEEDSRMLSMKVAGRTLEEIGADYGISKQRVSVRIQRAVSRLDESEKRYLYGDR
jgi:hypothetical protein